MARFAGILMVSSRNCSGRCLDYHRYVHELLGRVQDYRCKTADVDYVYASCSRTGLSKVLGAASPCPSFHVRRFGKEK